MTLIHTVNDHDLFRGLLLAELVEDAIDGLAEDDTGGADFLGRANVQIWDAVGLDVVEDVTSHVWRKSAGFEILKRGLDGDDIVAVRGALDVSNTRSHNTLADDCIVSIGNFTIRGESERTRGGALMVVDLNDTTPDGREVLALSSDNLETMALKGLHEIVALQILRGMAGDRHIVVINDQLDVQALCDSKPRGLSIVSFLLRAIGAEHEHGFISVCQGDTVDPWPNMSETARGELDSRCETKLGVTRELGVGFTVVEEVLRGEMAFDGGEEILRRDTVTWKAVKLR